MALMCSHSILGVSRAIWVQFGFTLGSLSVLEGFYENNALHDFVESKIHRCAMSEELRNGRQFHNRFQERAVSHRTNPYEIKNNVGFTHVPS